MRRPLLPAALGLCLWAAAGCGTTVAGSAVSARQEGLVASPVTAPAAPTGSRQPRSGTAERPALAGGGPSRSLPPTATGTPLVPRAVPLTGPGYDAKHLYLGVEYSSDFDTFFSSAGYSAISAGDPKALTLAILADVNAHGGVFGRTVVPVFHDMSSADAARDPETTAQATCAAFSDDKRVFAAVIISDAYDCLADKHVPSVITGRSLPLDSAFLQRRAPHLYAPTVFAYDKLTPLLLDRLTAQGYFPAGAKVGLLWGSIPGTSEVEDAKEMRRQLEARGIDVAATFEYDGTNAGTITATAPRAVLPFRTAGVDHVIGLDANVALFMVAAEHQRYRPRYAISSYLNPASVMESVPPPAQLKDAVGVGWEPANDVAESHQLSPYPLGSGQCTKDLARTGQRPTGSARFILYSYCDSIRLMLMSARQGGGFSPTDVRTGATRLGSSFPAALAFRAAYSATRTDGASAVRDLRYDSSCSCFRYVDATLRGTP